MKRLSHLTADGQVRQVDVSAKAPTLRSATARAVVRLPAAAARVLRAGGDTAKGNVLQIARIAGIQAAKRTAELIPLCHQVPLDGVSVEMRLAGRTLRIDATARCTARTGVEMEALTAASVAALTVYDMLKAVSHDLVIGPVELLAKDGGRSGPHPPHTPEDRMITYAEAVAALEALPVPAMPAEQVPVAAARGRVLAAAVAFAADQPPFDRATMDGFAVVLPGPAFAVVGSVHAGEAWGGPALRPGEAVRIMTGAPAPAGTTVVPIEACRVDGAAVAVTEAAALAPRRNIAWRGEDARAGHAVLPAGTPLTPVAMAVAAMAGAAAVAVRRRPRMRIVPTGDELGSAAAGGIVDSNGPFLLGFADACGAAAEAVRCADRLDALTAALAAPAEIVVTTGGVSAGDRDLVPAAARAAGFATVFHHVAIQPGKPVMVARHGDGRLLVGLPGNPVSVLACAHLFVLPLLHRLLGLPAPPWTPAPLACAWKAGRRDQFLPARISPAGVAPIPWNGSGDLVAAAAGSHLVALPAGRAHEPSDTVRILPYAGGPGGGLLPPSRG